ncbi:MAG: ATP-dependent helicase [Gemmatimonadaceae bacterium]
MAWNDELVAGTPAYEVAASTSNRIRVLAGPGTGKSFAMNRRVARLLEVEKVAPAKVLAVTFTRVAADDLHRDLAKLGVVGLHGRTVHSLAMSILMRNHVLSALGRHPRALSKFELTPLMYDLGSQHGTIHARRKLMSAYGAAWARLQADDPGFTRTAEEQRFQDDLISWLRFHRAMLLEEIIPHLYKFLKSNPSADELREFSHVLVDEYQDLNRAEQDTLYLLGEASSLCVIGDDDQSIYSFKHAHPQGIREWSTSHSGVDFGIDDCRRCPTTVVRMANALIAKNPGRVPARAMQEIEENGPGEVVVRQYRTVESEAAAVAEKIERVVSSGVSPGEIMVLAQREGLARTLFDAIQTRNVPVKSYYAESALDTVEAQERYSLLKLLVNKQDRVALRWLLGRGHAKWHAEQYGRIMAYASGTGEAPREILERLAGGGLAIPRTTQIVRKFEMIATELAALSATTDLTLFLDRWLPSSAETKLLAEAVAEHKEECSTPEELYEALQESMDRPEVPPSVNEVRIMSLHKSKGLSAPFVFIAGCVEGLLPSSPSKEASDAEKAATLEEDRRLFYVGITRVKARPEEGRQGYLALSYSQTMESASTHVQRISPARRFRGIAYLQASQFLADMAPHVPSAQFNRPL